jgi:hypothetical protein
MSNLAYGGTNGQRKLTVDTGSGGLGYVWAIQERMYFACYIQMYGY